METPNVIIVLSDDQGYGDFSCHGNPVLKTPALDRLYNESIRFSNFHVSPLCTPTRGQLLTGLDAMDNRAATVLTGRNLLRRDVTTMPEIFSNNGYATGIFGKWHLGDNYPDRPMDKGFQKSVWHKGWGLLSEMEYDNDYYETRYLDSLETKVSGEYCTNLWFNKAMEWMDEMARGDKPFFTYLALNAPHGPFFSPAQDYSFYANQSQDSTRALFLGMIRNIDRNMGRLDAWLEKTGLKNNTVVIYMTDNGGTGGVEVYNAGMRDKKGSNYEGGHRAACFIRWPDGNLGNQRTIPYATQVQDILPTLIDLFGLQAETNYAFDGMSLTPALRSEKKMDNRMFVVQHGGQVRPEKYFSCVVWDSWRLVGENELYNIDTDPGQKKDVSKEFPKVATRMKEFYERWWGEIEAGVDQYVPHIIDSKKQNPVILNSSNWTEGAINSQWRIARGDGAPKGGVCHIRVINGGKYRVELSRWPFHLQRNMVLAGPSTAIGGAALRVGNGMPIEYGCVSVNQKEPVVARKISADASAIVHELELPAGDATLQAWFKDKDNKNIVGAYYVRIEKIDQK
ncbi:MAG: arylsulfatase [Cyclobacteriaceae bacterium]